VAACRRLVITAVSCNATGALALRPAMRSGRQHQRRQYGRGSHGGLRTRHATAPVSAGGASKGQTAGAVLGGKANLSCPAGYTLEQDKLGLPHCAKRTALDCPKGTFLNEASGTCCPPEKSVAGPRAEDRRAGSQRPPEGGRGQTLGMRFGNSSNSGSSSWPPAAGMAGGDCRAPLRQGGAGARRQLRAWRPIRKAAPPRSPGSQAPPCTMPPSISPPRPAACASRAWRASAPTAPS
jgi:hypothetical protein